MGLDYFLSQFLLSHSDSFSHDLPFQVMRRHRHSSSHGPYPMLTQSPLPSAPIAVASLPTFSKRLLEILAADQLELLQRAGFQDDFDLKGLSVTELQALVPGLVEQAASACLSIASLAKGSASAATSAPTHHSGLNSTEPSVITWKAGPASKAPLSGGKHDLVLQCWVIFQHMGRRGLRWSPLVDSQPASAKTVFCNSLARCEETSLKGHLASWRRWKTFARPSPTMLRNHPWRPLMHSWKTRLLGGPRSRGASSSNFSGGSIMSESLSRSKTPSSRRGTACPTAM